MNSRRKTRAIGGWTLASICLLSACRGEPASDATASSARSAGRYRVAASLATEPVPVPGDVADDVALWIHPTDPSASVIIAALKSESYGGLALYDLSGRGLDGDALGRPVNNVDLRFGIYIGGRPVDVVAASNRHDASLSVFEMSAERELSDIAESPEGVPIRFGDAWSSSWGAHGICLYHSRRSDKLYAFVTAKTGVVAQVELRESAIRPGTLTGVTVRTFDINPGQGDGRDDRFAVEGCVADDAHAFVYLAEEDVGIWRYDAEPGPRGGGRLIQTPWGGERGDGDGDVEGLALYQSSDETGYLIASIQGDNSFNVYDRTGDNELLAQFWISYWGGDAYIADSDGIDVLNLGLGGRFASGLFVAQNGSNANEGGPVTQDFQLVSWEDIALGADPPLRVDATFNPRTAEQTASARLRDARRIDDDRRAQLYERAQSVFGAAYLLRPQETEDALATALAPLIVFETSDSESSNAVAAGDSIEWPVVYYERSRVQIAGSELDRWTYFWWDTPSDHDPAEHPQGVRMTLDRDGFPALVEVFRESSGAELIFVSTTAEEAAAAHVGPPLPGRRFSIEPSLDAAPTLVVAGTLERGPIPLGPFVYVEQDSGDVAAILCRCMPSQVDRVLESLSYRLLPLEELRDPRREQLVSLADLSWALAPLRLPADVL